MNLYKYVSESINAKLGTPVNLEIPRNRDFGDFATNAAMVMAKSAGKNRARHAGGGDRFDGTAHPGRDVNYGTTIPYRFFLTFLRDSCIMIPL